MSLLQPGPSPAALERQIVRCGQMNNFRDALFLLDQLRAIGPPSAKAINSVAAACARSGQYDRTFSLLKELSERGAWDSFSYTTAITAHGKRRQWAKALALLRTIKEPNEFVFGAAIGACAAAGRWAEAIALLDDMEARGIPSNARCYNGALSACDRADQPEVALRLFEKMRTGEEERIRPTTISYTSAISACARRPSYAERSPALLAQMRRDGLRPNAVTFGATAQAYATLGHWEAALQLLADMEAEGVAPNIVVLSNIVNACAEAAEWKPALALTHGRGIAGRQHGPSSTQTKTENDDTHGMDSRSGGKAIGARGRRADFFGASQRSRRDFGETSARLRRDFGETSARRRHRGVSAT